MICLEMMGSRACRCESLKSVLEGPDLHRRHRAEAEECEFGLP